LPSNPNTSSRPIPPAAPVTIATRCCSLILSSLRFGPTTLRQWGHAAQGDLHPTPRRHMLRGEDQASRDNLGSRSSRRLRLPILRAKHDKRRPGMERLRGKTALVTRSTSKPPSHGRFPSGSVQPTTTALSD
jgi:hypothetical protein